ncbi:MAG: GGDEF domain-containing protein [Firmicutes bacterium]|nr:GGDEF domain-containing protein [Bacillota bacterium]
MERIKDWLRENLGLGKETELPEIPKELFPIFEAVMERIDVQKKRIEKIENELAFYKASANAMPNPIFIKDGELKFVFFNKAYKEFFGLSGDEYIGKDVKALKYIPEEDRERYHQEDSSLLASKDVMQYETAFKSPETDFLESLYWSKGFGVPETGEQGIIGEIVDISDQKKVQRNLARNMQVIETLVEKAETESRMDPVTSLFNRRVLKDDVPRIIEDAKKRNMPVCSMILDIDYFKEVNDTFGHLEGDAILKKLADVMKASFRQSDILIRYGGDEFIIILPETKLVHANMAAERLCTAVRREILLPNGKNITISVGVAESLPQDDFLALVSRADEGLYMAKALGRDRVVIKSE